MCVLLRSAQGGEEAKPSASSVVRDQVTRTGRLEAKPSASSVVRDQEIAEMLKRTHHWQVAEAKRLNQPENIPAPHPDLDEKGKFKKPEKGDALYRPKDKDDEDENHKLK